LPCPRLEALPLVRHDGCKSSDLNNYCLEGSHNTPSEPEEISIDCDDLIDFAFGDCPASMAAKNEYQVTAEKADDPMVPPKGLYTPGPKVGLFSQGGSSHIVSTAKSEHVLRTTSCHPTDTPIEKALFTPGLGHRLPLVTPRQNSADATTEQASSSFMWTPQPSVANTPARTMADTTPNDSADRAFDAFLAAFEGGHFTRTATECLSTGISRWVLLVSSENADLLRFSAVNGSPIGFCNTAGDTDDTENGQSHHKGRTDDYMRALRTLYHDEDLCIQENWITNHLRWIIWKLASMERRFAPYLVGQALTYETVLRQLSTRYEREIRQGLRPSLRKLVNRDACSTSMMILCVARIIRIQQTEDQTRPVVYGLELTDGWYSVRSEIDQALSALIDRKRISVGSKLVISNAKLLGMQEGADHLDAGYDVFDTERSPRLEIRANGCRIAHWSAKLGFVPLCRQAESDSGFLMTKGLRDVLINGGTIPQIDVVVVGSDPVKYLERGTDGTSRVWSEAEESERMEEMEKSRQKLVELFRDEITKECEDVSVAWTNCTMMILTFCVLRRLMKIRLNCGWQCRLQRTSRNSSMHKMTRRKNKFLNG
jgi:hypothetical protein